MREVAQQNDVRSFATTFEVLVEVVRSRNSEKWHRQIFWPGVIEAQHLARMGCPDTT